MKRRNFIKSLLAAPLAAKAVVSEGSVVKNADYTPEIKRAMLSRDGFYSVDLTPEQTDCDRLQLHFSKDASDIEIKPLDFTRKTWDASAMHKVVSRQAHKPLR